MFFFDNPWKELELVRRDMDLLSSRLARRSYRFPAVNVYDSDEALTVEFVVPGLTKEELSITFENGNLAVKGERKGTVDPKMSSVRQERNSGPFNRVVEIPIAVESHAITASMKEGILTIILPKSEEAKPKQIQIR